MSNTQPTIEKTMGDFAASVSTALMLMNEIEWADANGQPVRDGAVAHNCGDSMIGEVRDGKCQRCDKEQHRRGGHDVYGRRIEWAEAVA
jgi:hypothetical protein